MTLFYLIISFATSMIGSICGIGGGVIIKPTLDFLALADTATINFLSGSTVLAMASYNVIAGFIAKDKQINYTTTTPLALGAAVGGVTGNQLFSCLRNSVSNPAYIGRIQALCLMFITTATLFYTIFRSKISTKQVKGISSCTLIGIFLGLMSSFLGIGGGPVNLVVFYYFFSMNTKEAAQNSLYTIFFSQFASLITTIFTHSVPSFAPLALGLMILGGILGGIIGKQCNKKFCSKTVDHLFMILMLIIIAVSAYNMTH